MLIAELWAVEEQRLVELEPKLEAVLKDVD